MLPSLEATLKIKPFKIALILVLSFLAFSCSAPILQESTPEERVSDARKDIKKRKNEKAYETLEELRFVTAGTRLGGEVQFLLGEAGFNLGKYPEAESHYATYLNTYPDGPFSEQAVYKQALSKVKQIQKRKITGKSYIPHDRDISLLREARILFEIYVEKYPDGEWIEVATQRAEELLTKEGQHELGIASFYLKKKNPHSAIERAKRIMNGSYPNTIKTEARELIRKAEESLPQTEDGQNL
ncbi:MAG: outer membrane protein assembly factor BamD [bacterium]|nr:outer membrane protein assembly factor BamD [bacterium]MDT8365237.1 outer membrane protein assembly factor BamD [bacterium]